MFLRKFLGLMILGAACFAPGVMSAAEETSPRAPIGEWLVLGPALEPLPILGKTQDDAAELEAVLAASPLPTLREMPTLGETVDWSTGADLAWRSTQVDVEGRLGLRVPSDIGEGRAVVAWLVTSLRSDRYREVLIEVHLEHPHEVFLDGERVELGEEKKNGRSLALEQGSHLLLIKTVHDPQAEAPWSVGAALTGEHAEEIRTTTVAARGLGILDVLDATTVTAFDLAPDGARILLSLSRVRPGSDESESWVEIRTTDDGRILRTWRGAPAMTQAVWAPTGNRITYITRKQKEKTASLWLADLDSGATRALLEGVEAWGSYLWSPTGDAIVYRTTHEPEKDERGIKRLRGLLDRMADHRKTASLSLVMVPGGVRRQLTAGPTSTSAEGFSPDGRRLLVTRQIEDFSQRPYSRTELWELDLRAGGAKKLRDFLWLRAVEYAPDGRRLLVQGGVSTFEAAGVDLPEGTIPNDYDGQLFIWDPELDEVEAITRKFDPAVADAHWSRFDEKIYLLGINGDFNHLYLFDSANRRFSQMRNGIESVRSFAVAERAPTVVVAGTSVWQSQRLVALDGPEGSPRILLEPAADRFQSIRRGEVRAWDFSTGTGRVVPGRVYLPPGFEAEQRYPAIVNFYAGTSPIGRSFGGRYPAEWWAASGYVVYVPNPAGAHGRGQVISAVHVNDWGEVSGQEIIEATKAFLEAHPFVDPKRVGCIGASYGGFETMSLLTRTDLFAAAVAHAGISALSSYWGEGYWGYSYGAVANAESFPWTRPDIFVDKSPLFHADRVTTPLLLTHGDEDPNVPPGESDQFYAALKLLGVPVEYLRVAGLGHWIMEHDKRALWSKSIVAWFDRWLKDEPEWWDALWPEP